MKKGAITREIDKLGRIVIPSSLRENLGIQSGDKLEIISEGDKIILRKFKDGCVFCGSDHRLIVHNDRNVCRACVEKMLMIISE